MSHPINELMVTAMQSIKEMVDVNTIVGEAVTSPDGMVIIPISKVTFGFASGGGEYDSSFLEEPKPKKRIETMEDENLNYPFMGGSGAGISISPEAFMVVGKGQIKLMTLNTNTSLDRIIDLAPELLGKFSNFNEKKSNNKNPDE